MRILTDIAEYQGALGTAFQLQAGPGLTVPLQLNAVTIVQDTPVQFAYSLFFTAPAPMLRQNTYALTHDRLGELYLFLVPIGQVAGGFKYQAVFTLLKESPVASS